jgi:hypothetical protein
VLRVDLGVIVRYRTLEIMQKDGYLELYEEHIKKLIMRVEELEK